MSENLTSVSVLVFALGFIAARFKSDIRIPEPVYQIISVYLLFGIGLKGGVALRNSNGSGITKPVIATILLGIIVPLLAYLFLRLIKNLNEVDRGAISAHYGSTSLVTFTAALVFLENAKVSYEGFATTLLTIMEVPGIIVGIFLATRNLNRDISWSESGDTGYQRVAPFFVDLLPGILALFLMHLGFLAGAKSHAIREVGPGLAIFAILFPVFAGTLGVIGGELAGLSIGGATVLGVLCASASYIAAPAAVQIAVPEANPSLSITASLAITFPFNLIIGIPLLKAIAVFIS
jgi:hypothetical protein